MRRIVGLVAAQFKRTSSAATITRLERTVLRFGCATCALFGVVACAGTDRTDAHSGTFAAIPFYATRFERQPSVAELTALGRTLFFDSTLSASGRMSCATCHSPDHAWGPPNALAVQYGGATLNSPGVRAVPSLRYQQDTPAFDEHFMDDDGDDGLDQGPAGGRNWDGRASSAHDQARGPLLSPFEMANSDSTAVVERLRNSPSAPRFRATFGARELDDTPRAWVGVLLALEVFQQSPADFYPYASRYDDYLRGTTRLSVVEQRGLAVFNDPARGNCAQCHFSEMRRGAFPQFTDYGFAAIGVPRNRAIPANADPTYYDLGLCGPLRTDLAAAAEFCGMFKAPTLRNVATRPIFFHNGAFTRIEDAVAFYQYRDIEPWRYYPRDTRGRVLKFDDLPGRYRANISFDAPFDSVARGRPHFTDAEAADLIAFLRTLTDRP